MDGTGFGSAQERSFGPVQYKLEIAKAYICLNVKKGENQTPSLHAAQSFLLLQYLKQGHAMVKANNTEEQY